MLIRLRYFSMLTLVREDVLALEMFLDTFGGAGLLKFGSLFSAIHSKIT